MIRLPEKGNSNSHGARLVYPIITMITWFRTSTLPIKTLSLHEAILFWGGGGGTLSCDCFLFGGGGSHLLDQDFPATWFRWKLGAGVESFEFWVYD